MLSGKDVTLVYETLLSSPGMMDSLKISLQLSRKNVLLLSKVIENGLMVKQDAVHPSVLQVLSESDLLELQTIAEDLLRKGGLTAMNEKLVVLQSK